MRRMGYNKFGRSMYRSLAAIQLSRQLFKSYSRLPRVFFSSQSADESDDDFKPKSKVKDENPEEVLKFIDKVRNWRLA